MYTYFKCSGLTFLTDHIFYFFLCFFYHLFDSGRMDTSIYDQFFKSDTCHFTTDWIKTGQNNCFRCVINDQIYTCHRLKRTDITSLTSDDTSFHLVIWKLHNRNCSFGNMIGCAFLNCVYNVFFCFLSSLFFCLMLHFLDQLCSVQFYIFFNCFQEIFFCLFRGES